MQAARQYYKFFIKILKKIGFVGGDADPCLMMRKNKDGVVYIAIWVDDSLLIGNEKAINATIDDMKKEGLSLKIEGNLDDYLSCEISIDEKKKSGWIHQPHLIKKLEKKFGSMVEGLMEYKTPGTPHQTITRDVAVKISDDDQKLYRSGVGMLLWLVKHSRPDIANAVRELTKVLDGASAAAMKEMLRTIKYVLDTKNYALKMKPNFGAKNMWSMLAFCDSDYATDPDTRKSVSGFVLYLCGVPILWQSKGQKLVTLSRTKAEYISLLETAKEVKFVYKLLRSMGASVKLPITI